MSIEPAKEKGASKRRGLFYGWIIVLTVAAAHLAETGEFNPVLAVFMKPMAEDMDWSRAQISLGITIGSIVGAVLAPIAGRVTDRFGPRVAMSLGQLFFGVFLFGVSLAEQIFHFYLTFSVGRGIVLGVTSLAGNVAVSNWFVRKRGRAIGLASLGSRAGQAFLPIASQFVISNYGWRLGWRLLGGMVWVVAMVPSFLFLRQRPEQMGLRPDGDPPDPPVPSPNDDDTLPRPSTPTEEPQWTLREAVRSPALWLLTLAAGQGSIVGAGVNLHLFSYLTDKGIPEYVAVGITSVLFIMGGVGGLAWGFLAERLPIRFCVSASFFLASICVLVLMQVNGTAMAFVFAISYGFILGGWNILISLMIANYFGRRSLGTITGFIAPFQLAANSVGPIAAGLAYDMTGGYVPAFIMFAVSYLLASFWMLLAKPPATKAVKV